jgi:hypothetical protein
MTCPRRAGANCGGYVQQQHIHRDNEQRRKAQARKARDRATGRLTFGSEIKKPVTVDDMSKLWYGAPYADLVVQPGIVV